MGPQAAQSRLHAGISRPSRSGISIKRIIILLGRPFRQHWAASLSRQRWSSVPGDVFSLDFGQARSAFIEGER
jgi:hypothetical protein